VKCKDCNHEYLLAFSWKCRCFQMVYLMFFSPPF
jgi:hypothetical protein